MYDFDSLDLSQLVALARPYLNLNLFLPHGPAVVAGGGALAGLQYARWSLGRRQVRGARFDTGPNGLSTFYDLLRDATGHAFKWLVYAVAAWLVVGQLRRWVDLDYACAFTVGGALIGILVLAWAPMGFCLGRALSHAGHWLALEARGMRYEVRNGQRYRVRFIHKSGAVTIDNTPWEARIQAEQERLAQNDTELHQQLKALLVALFPAAVWCFAIIYGGAWARGAQGTGVIGDVLRYCGTVALTWRLDIVVPAIVIVQRAPAPFAGLMVAVMDRLVYGTGARFASLVHVKEAADTRIDLKDVLGQKATGEASFAKRTGRRGSLGS